MWKHIVKPGRYARCILDI